MVEVARSAQGTGLAPAIRPLRLLMHRELSLWGSAGPPSGKLLRARAQARHARTLAQRLAQIRQTLDGLAPTWSCLHDAVVGDVEVDHLMVGPGGVVAIARHLHERQSVWVAGGTIVVDGEVVPHVRHSRERARLLSERLSAAVGFDVPVNALVMIAGQSHLDLRHQPPCPPGTPRCVDVVAFEDASAWLASRPAQLTPDEVDRIRQAVQPSSD